MTPNLAIELAPFTLANGVSESDLFAASDRLEQEFLSRLDGYRGRLLARLPDGAWSDIVFWQSAGHARAAMAQAASSPVCRSYFACMRAADHDQPDQGVSLFEAVRRYGMIGV